MPNPTLTELASMPYREYSDELRLALRNNEAWLIFVHPYVIERTRDALKRLILSLDRQREEAQEPIDRDWVNRLVRLKQLAVNRLVLLPPEPIIVAAPGSSTREARDWRALSAQLAGIVERINPAALDALQAPYGGLTVAQWLQARREKGAQV